MPRSKLARNKTQRIACGMTLIEMLCFIVLVIFILIGVFFGSAIIGSWYGWLLGAVLGLFVFLVSLMALAVLKDLWTGSGLPKCRNGCCRGPGYFRGYGNYDTRKVGEEYYDVCKCGDRYQRRGKRFVLVNEDGAETPYLIWRRFRGWCSDEGHEK